MMRPTGKLLAPLAFAALGAVYSGGAAAQFYTSGSSGRAGTWEWYGEVRFIFAKDINFGHGTSINTDDDAGFGLGFGYNIDDHWLASFEFQYNELNYKATVASADTPPKANSILGGTAQISRFGGGITYNLLSGPLTPYGSANIGWAWVDTNIPTGPPQTGCWWDPWFGYLCSSWQPTATNSGFTYGLGLGMRWDAGQHFFVRFGYEYDWVELSHASGTPAFSLLRLQFGAKY